MVFMEMNRNLQRKNHMVIECVPVDKEIGDMAPIYFKVCALQNIPCIFGRGIEFHIV
jgi:hypothetical protein